MKRRNKTLKKKDVKEKVISFFETWSAEKDFVGEMSLRILPVPDFKELFSRIKTLAFIKGSIMLKAMCSSTSSSKLIIEFVMANLNLCTRAKVLDTISFLNIYNLRILYL